MLFVIHNHISENILFISIIILYKDLIIYIHGSAYLATYIHSTALVESCEGPRLHVDLAGCRGGFRVVAAGI